MAALTILYEDNHLLALAKPVGLPTMGVAADETSLLTLAKDYIRQKHAKPGNVYLGVVSRLDAAASGVVVFARTSKAAARLSEQFRERRVEKTYWALVAGRIEPAGEYVDSLAKNESAQRVEIVVAADPAGKLARLTFRRLEALPDLSLVEIELETGRKHQIRVQFAGHGHPIAGDRKYGSRQPFPAGIALHARQLVFEHPTTKVPVRLEAPLPKAWQAAGVRLA